LLASPKEQQQYNESSKRIRENRIQNKFENHEMNGKSNVNNAKGIHMECSFYLPQKLDLDWEQEQ